MSTTRPYTCLLIVGEWDRLHEGHKYALSKAFELANKVVVVTGLFPEEGHGDSYFGIMQSWKTRVKNVHDFIESLGYTSRAIFYDHEDTMQKLLNGPVPTEIWETIIFSQKDLTNVCMQRNFTSGIQIRQLINKTTKTPVIIDTLRMPDGAVYSASKLRARENMALGKGV
jgi:phosphopantetheine adenylyltransferase